MTREEIILKHVKRDGLGLEIGAGCAPVAPKKRGFRVHVLDHCDKNALIGRRHAWIIGSHVLEHTTDLLGFLNDCDSLLKKGRVLSLVVPDNRYCFDRFRPLTGVGRVIDAARNPQKIHSAGTAAEYFLTVVSKGDHIAWDPDEKGEFKLVHSLEQAKQAIRDVSVRGYYLDVHEWCFTPTSFRLMMRDLFELGFIQLKELAFHPPQGSEFYITLSRQGRLPEGTRLELLGQILREQSVA